MNVGKLTLIVFLMAGAGASGQTSFWSTSTLPTNPASTDTGAVTLGLSFSSDVPGAVTGVRFYKGPGNGGTHTGNLWSASGANLASVTFSGETASGWQQANFSTPVNIAANTKYVISYTAPQGAYADDQGFGWTQVNATPLHVSGSSPSVYNYAAGPAFPNQTYNNTNYWVDVIFAPATAAPTYRISGQVLGTAANLTLSGPASASTATDASGNYSFAALANGSYTLTPSKSGYTFAPASLTVSVNGANVSGANFTGTSTSNPPISFWSNSSVPGTIQDSDTSSVTLGLQFYSDVAGTVAGVRFYKGSANSGTHVGTLWTATGTPLATATFSGETASGWQQVNFSTPVAINAKTNYVVSYLAPNGAYSADQTFNWSSLTTGPLHVAGTSPGVYAYGSSNSFPQSTYMSSNYWVDVAFVSSSGSVPPPSTYTISGSVQGTAATLSLSGVTSGSTVTGSSGQFSFSGLANGQYVISASQPGYTFAPSLASVAVNGASVQGITFVGTATSTPVPHTVTLNWSPSTTTNLKGYNVYRADVAGGSYVKLSATPLSSTSYVDNTVASGRTYYYVATAVDNTNAESTYSNQTAAVVPVP